MPESKTSSSASPETAVVLYDDDCGICKFILARLLEWDRAERLRPVRLQDPRAEELLPGLSEAERMRSFHVVEADGTVHSAEAGLAKLADYLPGFPRFLGPRYGVVAGNRGKLGKLLPGFAKRQAERRIASRS